MIALAGPGHEHGSGVGLPDPATLLALLGVAGLALGYVLLAQRRSQGPHAWSVWRTASFVGGAALLALGLLPSASPFPVGDFRTHMWQHLLVGMYAPLGLVLGAPVTLLLRSLPRRYRGGVGRVLRSAPVAVLGHPVTALLLNVGALYLLYGTGLYAATTRHGWLHHLVHLHFLLAGCLFAYAIAGADPAPHRPSVPARLVVLGVAVLGHAVLAQLLYAGVMPVDAPAEQVRGGADLMYYAGDIGELLLALALVSTWRPVRAGGGLRAAAARG